MAQDPVLLDLCCSMAEHSVHDIMPGACFSAAQAIQSTHRVSQQLSTVSTKAGRVTSVRYGTCKPEPAELSTRAQDAQMRFQKMVMMT